VKTYRRSCLWQWFPLDLSLCCAVPLALFPSSLPFQNKEMTWSCSRIDVEQSKAWLFQFESDVFWCIIWAISIWHSEAAVHVWKGKKPEHALQWQLLVTVSQWVSFVMCTIVGPNICTAWWNLCYYLPKESACQVLQALQWLSNVKASGSSSSYIICKLGMTRHQSMLWSLTVLSHCLVLVGVEQAWCHERTTAAIDNLWEAQHVGLGNIAK